MSATTWVRLLGLSTLVIALGFVLPAFPQTEKGKKYALLVGVTEYKGEQFGPLKYTENDVEKLAEILNKAGFDKVRLLSTKAGKMNAADAPTAANIKKAIEELVEDKGQRDTVLIAFSGHGVNVSVDDPDEKGKAKVFPYFCPHDASTLGISYGTGRSKFLVNLNVDLFDKLEQCGARSKLVLIDACRNELKAKEATRSLESDKVSIPAGVGVLFSCSKNERAWETEELKHGVFFHFVLEGLRGKAKNDDNEVTWPRLVAYVTEQVERQVPLIIKGGANQTPHLQGNVRGAPILVPASRLAADDRKDKGGKGETPGKVDVVKDIAFSNSLGMKFVRVKAGMFTMGSPKEEKERKDEELEHEVELTKDYFMQTTEVTQKQFLAVMGFNPSYFSLVGKKSEGRHYYAFQPTGGRGRLTDFTPKQLEDFPVENVSWDEAKTFVDKLNEQEAKQKTKVRYLLPTEAQWEYACRGGHLSKKLGDKARLPFHFETPSASLSATQANFDGRYPFGGGKAGAESKRTNRVGENGAANALGLSDMHGNVWEWCSDWFDKDYYGTPAAKKDPTGPVKPPRVNSPRVMRGGSYSNDGWLCRAAHRGKGVPGDRDRLTGFRLAAVPQE